MLGAEVPLWFAAVIAVIPIAGSLLTLLLSNRQATAARNHESAEREKDREHAITTEVRRELRAERRDLYRRLIDRAKAVLDVGQPMSDRVNRVFAKLDREAQGFPPEVEPLGNAFTTFDVWRDVLTETEFLGSAAVVEAARQVDERAKILMQHRHEQAAVAAESGTPTVFDPDVEEAAVRISWQLIRVLTTACSDDMSSRTRG